MVMFSSFDSDLQVLILPRPAYQKLVRVIRPIVAVAMREHGQIAFPGDMPQVNEKQEAWLERSHHWWKLYRSFARALGLLSRVYSSSGVAS